MTQSTINTNTNHERSTSIVNRASFIGFYTPFVPWAWHNIAEPIKLTPIAFNQVIHGDRSISSLLLLLGLITYLFLINIFYMWLLNKWRRDFLSLYKEELMNFKDAPIKNSVALIKLTAAVALFGGSAFFVSKFFMFP
jgi:hypothetical protein